MDHLVNGVYSGAIPQADVNRALKHALSIRFRLGLFDPIDNQPFWKIPASVVQSTEHVQLAKEMTAQGVILLQSLGTIARLDPSQSVALIGPHVRDRTVMLGNYIGEMCANNPDNGCITSITSFQEGFEKVTNQYSGTLRASLGCKVYGNGTQWFDSAKEIAAESDVVVFMGGLNMSLEREEWDWIDIGLPTIQKQLLQELSQVNPNIVLVLMHGGMLAVYDLSGMVASIVSVGYPGRYAGEILPQVLNGIKDRAWEKVAVTWYKQSMKKELNMLDFDMSRPPGRTYRYYTGEPQFSFGFGPNPLATFRFENI